MARTQIPAKYKWQLDPLFAKDDAFDQALEKTARDRKALATFRGKLAQPDQLRACLDQYFKLRLLTNKLTLYAQLRFDSNQKSAKLSGMNDLALHAMHGLIDEASFIRREVIALDDLVLGRAYRAAPKLAEYRPYLDELRRRRKRVLGSEAERILSLAADNLWAEIDLNELPSDIEKVFKAARSDMPMPKIKDEQGQEVQLTLANFGKYRGSQNRSVRQATVESFFESLRTYENTYAATLSGQVRLNVFYARARGYDTALEAYLDKDNIAPAVYHNLITAIHANLAPLHRYMSLRKKLMKVDELHIYDLYAPLVKGTTMTASYEEAREILPKALAPLGEDYVKALRHGLDPKSGWIDVYPHQDKDSGAFSVAVYGTHPFIKMNYLDDMNDLSTLAHEYGHGIHSHLSMNTQPYISFNYSSFNAEIASTLNEKFLSDYLLEHADNDDQRLSILNNLVESIRTTIYRQSLFAEFELAIHTAVEKGKPLTAQFLNDTYGGLIRKYYGPGFTVGKNDGVEWAYIPHFYYKYYVFSYATGLSAGIALADRIKNGGPQARDAYLGMLKGGSSKPPLELLKAAGVDLTKPTAIATAAKLMDKTLTRIEAILAKKQ
jgi:oligoendopeptidase F